MTDLVNCSTAKAHGLKRYFTGRPCKNGHVSERYVSGHVCVLCNEDAKKKYANKDPEKLRIKKRDSIRRSRARDVEKHRQWQRNHYSREKTKNPAGLAEENRKGVREWRQKYPERAKASDQNKRAKRMAATGSHTAADIENILAQQNHKCTACKADLRKAGYHVDHIVALSRGGTNWPENLQALCPTCNMEKYTKDFSVFLTEKQVQLCAY